MPGGGAHHARSIDKRLASLGSTPIDQECCVFKVHHRLRQINHAAYEPAFLAIGPYHRGKDQLSFMEKHKLRFLQRMLRRRNENSAERYITAMTKKEERARRFYADQFPGLSKDEFVEMMLLDGCFIIELFRIQRDFVFASGENDPIFQSFENEPIFQINWMNNGIMRDLLLFENQLPFFILIELFEMSEGCNQQYDYAHCESTTSANQSEKNQTVLLGSRSRKSSKHVIDSDQKHEITIDESSILKDVSERVPTRLLDHALAFFYFALELSYGLNVNGLSYVSTANIKHLLGLIHEAMCPSPKEGLIHEAMCPSPKERGAPYSHKSKDLLGSNENEDWKSILYATDLQAVGVEFEKAEKFRDMILGEIKAKREEWKSIPNVIELQKAGVKFKKAETGNLFHIKFNMNGVMEIPPLNIVSNTESVFRNLIAYEQYSRDMTHKYVTDFATLMDYLINTPKDVELLRQNGIINNWMGDDEFVSSMFNRLGRYTFFSDKFYYADIIKEVNKHCDTSWNIWKANLRRDYFNSPWALLSVLAAVLLLLVAIVQTVFSVLSYAFK